jgi:hypothetical protein
MIFNLSTDRKFSNGRTNFIPLGNHSSLSDEQKQFIEAHLPFSKTEKIEKIWGTLGWKDDKLFEENGTLQFSENGQLNEAKGATLQQIKMLYDIYPEIPVNDNRVRERYIDLDDLKIKAPANISLRDMKELRLDIFLDNNEGAIVYLQHSDKANFNEDEAFIEYISAQPTDDNNRLDHRNRLTYHIPFQFKNKLKPNGLNNTLDSHFLAPVRYLEISNERAEKLNDNEGNEIELEETSFIIKVLTFIRKARTPEEALKSIGSNIAKQSDKPILQGQLDKFGQNKYALLKFVPAIHLENEDGQFEVVKESNSIELGAKTLLLIHGTFKDTFGTFGDFITKKYDSTDHSFLNYLINEGYYEQILAFDHPYFWDTPEENAKWLIDNHFANSCFEVGKLDIMGASRGALLAMYLATDTKMADHLKPSRVISFSGGSSGYVQTVAGLSKWISILKMNAPLPVQKLLLGVASIGLNYVHKNSGLAALMPGSEFLQKIYSNPLPNPVYFKPMVADWHLQLVTGRGWVDTGMKRALASGLDTVIKLFLGWQNDWVIGSSEQRKLPEGLNSNPLPSFEYSGMHGKYFINGFPQKKVNGKWVDAEIYQEILDFLK